MHKLDRRETEQQVRVDSVERNRGLPGSFGGLICCVEERSWGNQAIGSNTDFIHDPLAEIFTSHVAMDLHPTAVNLGRKIGYSGVVANVLFKGHVAISATLFVTRQALCNIFWHRRNQSDAG
jgi:hypothetical protein